MTLEYSNGDDPNQPVIYFDIRPGGNVSIQLENIGGIMQILVTDTNGNERTHTVEDGLLEALTSGDPRTVNFRLIQANCGKSSKIAITYEGNPPPIPDIPL